MEGWCLLPPSPCRPLPCGATSEGRVLRGLPGTPTPTGAPVPENILVRFQTMRTTPPHCPHPSPSRTGHLGAGGTRGFALSGCVQTCGHRARGCCPRGHGARCRGSGDAEARGEGRPRQPAWGPGGVRPGCAARAWVSRFRGSNEKNHTVSLAAVEGGATQGHHVEPQAHRASLSKL